MLHIQLPAEAEKGLERYARASDREMGELAGEWVVERLDREDLCSKIRNGVALDAADRIALAEEATAAWLRSLDAEDGGYDWGPDGPPVL